MAHRFIVPDSSPQGSPAPSTPEKTPGRRHDFSYIGDNPTTTPAGFPPSSAASFTPAGAPSESYLGSSIMRGVTDQRYSHYDGGNSRSGSATRLFGNTGNSNAPLGRSIAPQRQPSGLSRQFSLGNATNDQEEDEEDEDAEGEDEGLFRSSFAPGRYQPNDTDRAIERAINEDLGLEGDDEADDYEGSDAEGEDEEENLYDRSDDEEEEEEEEEAEEDDESGEQSAEEESEDDADMFLNMRHDDRPYGKSAIGEEETDLLMLNTPAATRKVAKEAEAIFRKSSNHFGRSSRGAPTFEFGQIAKNIYTQHDIATVNEPGRLILGTEALVSGMYTEGVDTVDNEERMDASLANVTGKLLDLWETHRQSLPQPEGEGAAGIGPEPHAEPFQKAHWIAEVVLRLHHSRLVDDNDWEEKICPLPEVLLRWMHEKHNLYPNHVQQMARHRPSPASHSLYWQTLRNLLLHGDIDGVVDLLRHAGWEHVRRGSRGEPAFTGQALKHVQRFTQVICELLESCPAAKADWDIWNSNWTLFRVKADAARRDMTLFAEGVGQDDDLYPQPPGMSNMAKMASSQLPWDIYENLLVLYGIVLGNKEAILDTAQDWCEATIGMMAWWSAGVHGSSEPELPSLRQSGIKVSSSELNSSDNYLERLAAALHAVTKSSLVPNTMNAVEVALASAFEGNIKGVLGILRTWSLPVACAVAEVASLGQWLPPPENAKPLGLGALDMEELALLNITEPGPDEVQGIKDSTLECYARQLAGIERLSPTQDGWEVSMQILGRMDIPEKSEETIGELLRDILKTLDENSSGTVDKMWRILNDLGMMNYAEETTETFAEILSRESHRYGEALWYYALSHRTEKVREVLNLLISHSLMHSTVFPPENELDEELRNLLHNRTATLERRAEQDLEAAQLLGRMLSGYATLRRFYELRDESAVDGKGVSGVKKMAAKKQSIVALVAVISSSDDNIRGGLYDDSRETVVSEDFLLALLGEASVFVNQSPSLLKLDQVDTLLKAIEDVETVGSRVQSACNEFFDVVIASGQGMKGSTPADLMKSTTSLSGSSYVLSGSLMWTSQLQKSIPGPNKVRRGWDWRKGYAKDTKADEVLRLLRLGLAKDLATLWLEDADGVVVY